MITRRNYLRSDTSRTSSGFTIVELLIVVVVIAILAAITLVSYNGITGRANDTAVQSDLVTMGKKLLTNSTDETYPKDETALSTQGIHVSKGAYGHHLVSAGLNYNALYCSTTDGTGFAFVGASKSGNVYVFAKKDGVVKTYANWTGGWGTICPDVLGVSAGNSNAGIWLYENDIWKVWL